MNIVALLPRLDVEIPSHNQYTVPGIPSLGPIKLGTFNLDTLFATAVAMVIVIGLGFAVRASASTRVPGKLQLLFEELTAVVRNYVQILVHTEGAEFVVPLAVSLGFLIFVANLLEQIPTHDALRSPTSDFNLTLAMSLFVIVLVQGYSIRVLGFGGYLRRYTKPFELPMLARIVFIPLNVIEELVKPLTLSLRLMFNIFTGGLMLAVIALLPAWILWGPNAAWKLFDLFVGLIQAVIFTVLTIIYFGMAREGLEEHH